MYNLNFSSHNKSWLTGFLKDNFPKYLFLDFYGGFKNISDITDNCIIYLDDEDVSSYHFFIESSEYFLDKKIILICKIKEVYDKLSSHGYSCLYYPYWHIVDDAIAVKKLQKINKVISNLTYYEYSYFCLNRRKNFVREQVINELLRLDLIKFGYVTYHGFSYTDNTVTPMEITGLQPSPDMKHYINHQIGFERHNHILQGIDYSSNVANYYYINENILAPINISVETKMLEFFPTEKTFLSFFTKRVPIVFAQYHCIENLRLEGFDLFDDYVDHSYDNITDPQLRITQGIESNHKILTNFSHDISLRTNANFNYLLNEWLDKKLLELYFGIKNLT
jgi:hypothetical protein